MLTIFSTHKVLKMTLQVQRIVNIKIEVFVVEPERIYSLTQAFKSN